MLSLFREANILMSLLHGGEGGGGVLNEGTKYASLNISWA